MRVLGITGGAATGKSVVTQMLADLGAPTISADALAHLLLIPGSALSLEVLAEFDGCARADDPTAVDRRALAALVFSDPVARARLEALTHPPIIAVLSHAVSVWRNQPGEIAAAEVPLLFEAGLEDIFDRVVVVSCDADTQQARLTERLGGDAQAARWMIAAQWPLEQKIARAWQTISTDAGLEDTRRQVRALWNALV